MDQNSHLGISELFEPKPSLDSIKPITYEEIRPIHSSTTEEYVHDLIGYTKYITSLLDRNKDKSLSDNMNLSHEKGESSNLSPLEIPTTDDQIESPVFHSAVEEQPQMRAQLDGIDETSDNLTDSPSETSPDSPNKADD